VLMRFDNLIGSGTNQIPTGATILSAKLTLNTSTTSNAQSAGPWGIAQLNQPFNSTTTYFGSFNCSGCTLVSRGAWWEDNYTQRPVAAYGNQSQGDAASADITSMVQNWANGTVNNGLVVQTGFPAGTTDGWGVLSTAHPLVQKRPKLEVTYTTGTIQKHTFQQGDANSYSSNTMAWVRSGSNIFGISGGPTAQPDASVDDVTYDGITGNPTVSGTSTITPAPTALTSFQQFLDGPQFNGANGIYGEADSTDDFALVKFGNVFGAGANQAPNGVPVAKAWLALSTGTASANAISAGIWEVHAMKRDLTTASLRSSFGSTPGLQEFDGDIGPTIDSKIGIIGGSQVLFDVTSYLEAARLNPASDFGLAVLTTQTADGWQIHLNGSDQALRPQLIVLSGTVSNPVTGLPGDYNSDGTVNAADYVLWRNGGPLANEGDNPGTVDNGDYTFWRAHFGQTASGSGISGQQAVPEPAAITLAFVAALGLCLRPSRKDK